MKTLRTGFTTGTCATAGAKAGILAIKEQKSIDTVDVLLPRGTVAKIKIMRCEFDDASATCTVIKDGGDDPDVTHGAEIITKVILDRKSNGIQIHGGKGVGKVTKPGLGLEIDTHAINPIPQKMIKQNVQDAGKELLHNTGVLITISVPKGEEIAVKTDNPRLGIIGGISILGTSGIVTPFSTASYAAAIRQNIEVARAMNEDTVVLTTGGRSEEYAMNIIKLEDHCFVQMGDFSGYAVRECAKNGITIAYVMGFVGKLAKMAAGIKQTHVKGSKVDMEMLAEIAQKCGANEKTIKTIRKANTARHVLEIVQGDKIKGFFDKICHMVQDRMVEHSDDKVEIRVILFDFDGTVLGRYGMDQDRHCIK
ncbi:MAG: cobalt-precorrin-6A synthase [Cenarchaeum symbiont of Oopsacas minuta]|nr:cobalt-precorrin-6A synthase [Cenarchaeum symbiont of Oopsacas minuta]